MMLVFLYCGVKLFYYRSVQSNNVNVARAILWWQVIYFGIHNVMSVKVMWDWKEVFTNDVLRHILFYRIVLLVWPSVTPTRYCTAAMVRAIAVKKYSAPDFKSLPGATYCNRSNLGVTTITNNIENAITSELIGNSRPVGS